MTGNVRLIVDLMQKGKMDILSLCPPDATYLDSRVLVVLHNCSTSKASTSHGVLCWHFGLLDKLLIISDRTTQTQHYTHHQAGQVKSSSKVSVQIRPGLQPGGC